jgi:hypothetical protein
MKTSFYTLLLIISLFACRKKEPQPELSTFNKGCDCAKEVSAEFLMEEMLSQGQSWDHYTDTDTLFMKRNVRFTAIDSTADYTWYIGAEKLNDRSFTRYFDQNLAGQTLPMTLVVKKKPNLICFPNDDGYDSVVRYLSISAKSVEDTSYLLEGYFRLKDPSMKDSVDIKVDFRKTDCCGRKYDLFNYDGNGKIEINIEDNGINYRQIWFDMQAHYATLHHQLNGVVTLEIRSKGAPNIPSFNYKGRKL